MVKNTERMETYLQWIMDAIEKIKNHIGKVSVEDIEKHPTILDACLMQLIHI
jgi:uncharacterized protein with HEPN domain